MSLPKLNQLEMLVAVADSGGFGAAAAQLGCTQSRVSHAITELETLLGARLLNRSRLGCTPTDAGFRVLAGARQILHLAGGLSLAAADAGSLSGHVRIASYRSVATHLLPPALEALAQAYPGIRIDIDDSFEEREAVAQAVRDGVADIGVAQLPVTDDLAVRPYAADSYVLVVPASKGLRAPVGWDQLEGIPYIQLNCSGAFAILEECRAAGFKEPTGVKVYPLPIPAGRHFAIVARPEIARTDLVRTVMRYLGERKSIERSEAFRAGALL
jgi:DNA-binding transcriptional LysR family regulator